MIRLLFKIALPFIFLTVGLSNCVNLKHVNDFSASALASVQKFEEIDYSFKQNCLDNCYDQKISQLSFDAEVCDCKTNEKADDVTLTIYHAVKGYFDGLTNLSNNKLTTYKMDALSKSLTQIDLNSVRIEKSQVEACTDISAILLRAFSDKYRRHKIKEYLMVGNAPVKVLIGYLDFNLSANLTGLLDVQKQIITNNYFDLTKDSTLSTYEKRKTVEEYYLRLNNIEAKKQELLTYSKALKKIAEGHQILTDNIDQISKDEMTEQLIQYASDIQDLISAFNKIAK